jgi:hypothetical protein
MNKVLRRIAMALAVAAAAGGLAAAPAQASQDTAHGSSHVQVRPNVYTGWGF